MTVESKWRKGEAMDGQGRQNWSGTAGQGMERATSETMMTKGGG